MRVRAEHQLDPLAWPGKAAAQHGERRMASEQAERAHVDRYQLCVRGRHTSPEEQGPAVRGANLEHSTRREVANHLEEPDDLVLRLHAAKPPALPAELSCECRC